MDGQLIRIEGPAAPASPGISPPSSPLVSPSITPPTPPSMSPAHRWSSRASEPVFGVALVDRRGNLLGAGTAGALAGEVEVPPNTDLRREDLRSYFSGDRGGTGGRRFPLVSATWVQVKSRRVRVGVYMELGEPLVNPDRLELDLGRIAAILSNQVVA